MARDRNSRIIYIYLFKKYISTDYFDNASFIFILTINLLYGFIFFLILTFTLDLISIATNIYVLSSVLYI